MAKEIIVTKYSASSIDVKNGKIEVMAFLKFFDSLEDAKNEARKRHEQSPNILYCVFKHNYDVKKALKDKVVENVEEFWRLNNWQMDNYCIGEQLVFQIEPKQKNIQKRKRKK